MKFQLHAAVKTYPQTLISVGDLHFYKSRLHWANPKTMSNSCGYDFEEEVDYVLHGLVKVHPDHVVVRPQCEFETPRPHRADFELEYKMGGLTHAHLIECQNRKKSSLEIADKIYAVRGTSERNRYIFVYKSDDFLSESLKKRFDDMGVLYYQFNKFKTDFVDQLDADLANYRIGLAVGSNTLIRDLLVGDEAMRNHLLDLLKTEPEMLKLFLEQLRSQQTLNSDVFVSASKFDGGRSNQADRAMLSGR